MQQPVGFFHGNPVGRVMSAVISDIEQMRAVFSDYLVDFFRQIFALVALVGVLLVIDWRMALARSSSSRWFCIRLQNLAGEFAGPRKKAALASPTSARSFRKPSAATAW